MVVRRKCLKSDAFNVFEITQSGLPGSGYTGVIQACDVGMNQSGQHVAFAGEPFNQFG
jgi:hypothetical protein